VINLIIDQYHYNGSTLTVEKQVSEFNPVKHMKNNPHIKEMCYGSEEGGFVWIERAQINPKYL